MNDAGSLLETLLGLLFVGVVIAVFVGIIYLLLVAIPRWIFRIDEIVSLLKNISSTPSCNTHLQLCEGCNRNFDKNQLKKIESGQNLCPECINNLKKRR